jgi:hypothetical protein
MNEQDRQTEPTRAETRSVAIVLLMLLVLLGAIVLQNLQQSQVQDMVVYVSDQTVYVAPSDGSWHQALMTLNADCMLFWQSENMSGGAFPAEMAMVNETASAFPTNSYVAFQFTAQGNFNVAMTNDKTTLTDRDTAYAMWPGCITTPSSQTWDVAVYEYNGMLYISNLLTGRTVTMLPLRENVLWSSETSFVVPRHAIAGQFDERDYSILPYGAQVIRTITTSTLIEVHLLDDYHVMLRYGGGEIVVMSY